MQRDNFTVTIYNNMSEHIETSQHKETTVSPKHINELASLLIYIIDDGAR